MRNILEILKEYSSPPAKSQQQWKLFAIVYAIQNGTRKGGTPSWYGRGKNKDPGMIGMMVKIMSLR